MTSVLSTGIYVAESTYKFRHESGNVMKPTIQAESDTGIVAVDRTTILPEVSA